MLGKQTEEKIKRRKTSREKEERKRMSSPTINK